jgi:glutathione S-transferase
VIELHQFAPMFGLMNASPFCMKVEVFLRLAGLDYRCVDALPVRAPKGKLPVLREDGRELCDSEAIVAHLQAAHGARMPAALAAPESPRQLLLRRVFEEHLYFAALWFRWVEDEGARHTIGFFASLPVPVRGLVFGLVRRKMKRDLHGQGLGRHAPAAIAAKAAADLDAIAATLGEDPFFGGAEPGAIDACAYAFLANSIWAPVETPLKAHALAIPALVAYCERMEARIGR